MKAMLETIKSLSVYLFILTWRLNADHSNRPRDFGVVSITTIYIPP